MERPDRSFRCDEVEDTRGPGTLFARIVDHESLVSVRLDEVASLDVRDHHELIDGVLSVCILGYLSGGRGYRNLVSGVDLFQGYLHVGPAGGEGGVVAVEKNVGINVLVRC
jgi:hypothetical protein